MAKNCPYCMTELPDDALFCYECGKPQPNPGGDEPRRPPRWLPILLFAAIVFAGFSIFRMSQPKDFLGTYALDYTAEDDATYHLSLSFGAPDDAMEDIVHTDGTPLTSYLYVTDANGHNAVEAFAPMVEEVRVIALPVAGTPVADLSQSGRDETSWNCVAYHNSDVGANIIRWTFKMENGDTLIISHRINYTEPQ